MNCFIKSRWCCCGEGSSVNCVMLKVWRWGWWSHHFQGGSRHWNHSSFSQTLLEISFLLFWFLPSSVWLKSFVGWFFWTQGWNFWWTLSVTFFHSTMSRKRKIWMCNLLEPAFNLLWLKLGTLQWSQWWHLATIVSGSRFPKQWGKKPVPHAMADKLTAHTWKIILQL